MTDEQARRVADIAIGVAAVAGVYYVLKTPPLRRMAWQLAKIALTSTVPAWLGTELRKAWAESARARDGAPVRVAVRPVEAERPHDMIGA